jgi:transcriptional regulator with XRE-family HTH domain
MLNTAVQPGLRQWPAMVKRLPHPPDSELLKGFGPRLVAARKALNLKAAEFARQLGVSPQRLANWEADTNPPEVYMLAKIKRLGISTDYLLSGDISNLTQKLLQAMVNQGAAPAADPVAREIRTILPDMPDPAGPPDRRRLHQRQKPAPGRLIHPPDVQDH